MHFRHLPVIISAAYKTNPKHVISENFVVEINSMISDCYEIKDFLNSPLLFHKI